MITRNIAQSLFPDKNFSTHATSADDEHKHSHEYFEQQNHARLRRRNDGVPQGNVDTSAPGRRSHLRSGLGRVFAPRYHDQDTRATSEKMTKTILYKMNPSPNTLSLSRKRLALNYWASLFLLRLCYNLNFNALIIKKRQKSAMKTAWSTYIF